MYLYRLMATALFLSTPQAVRDWTFEIRWGDGRVTTYSYPRTMSSDCYFDTTTHIWTCDHDYDYNEVNSTLTCDRNVLKYLSVRCLSQEYHAVQKNVCFCKSSLNKMHLSPASDSLHVASTTLRVNKHIQLDITTSSSVLSLSSLSSVSTFSKSDLSYRTCQIQRLQPTMFVGLLSLEVLDLSNNIISSVHPDTFQSLVSLKVLSLHNNPLSELFLEPACLPASLKILDLSHSQMGTFPTLLLHNCPSFTQDTSLTLTYLDLSFCKLTRIPARAFRNLGNLRFLNISGNPLLHLPVNPFTGAFNLTILDLSTCRLRTVPVKFCQGIQNLKHLSLAKNMLPSLNLKSLKACHKLTSLDVSWNRLRSFAALPFQFPFLELLNASRNRIGDIRQPLFTSRSLIKTVDLSYNNICLLSEDAFSNTEHLQILLLHHNKLQESSHLPSFLKRCSELMHLDISHNLLTFLPERLAFRLSSLRYLDLSSNRIHFVRSKAFRGLSSLTSLSLSNNSIATLDLHGLLGLTNLTSVNLSWNRLNQSKSNISTLLAALDLSHNRYTYFPNLFLPGLAYISFASNSISALFEGDFDGLRSIRELDVSRNRIAYLDAYVFHYLTSLRKLRLSHNNLTFLPGEVFSSLNTLELLDVSFNQIMSLANFTLPNSLTILKFMLNDNPWSCDCRNSEFVLWIQRQQERQNIKRNDSINIHANSEEKYIIVQNMRAVTCGNSGSLGVIDFDLDTMDCGGVYFRRKIIIFIAGVVFFVVCCIASFCYYRRKVVAAVLYTSFKLTSVKRLTREEWKPGVSVSNDITIICDLSDRKLQWWVESVLVPKLQQPRWQFSVKYPRRETRRQGMSQEEDISVHDINSSRCSVIIITSGFGQSQQCIACFNKAVQLTKLGRHDLVLVTWGAITADVMNLGIRPFVRTKLYLPITARFFWNRLFYQLPLPDQGKKRRVLKHDNFKIQRKNEESNSL